LDRPWGTHVYSALRPTAAQEQIEWMGVGITGHKDDEKMQLNREVINRMVIPEEFLALARPVIETGTTMMITDEPILESTTGKQMTLMTDKQPHER
jgi:hypothetical protein